MTTKRDSKSRPKGGRPKLKKETLRDLGVPDAEAGRLKAGGNRLTGECTIKGEATNDRHGLGW